jgi:putative SOS response-associated peptidase YedK
MMCGRFNFTDEQLDEIKAIIQEANARIHGQAVKTGEVCPTNLAAVMVWADNKVTPMPIQWGFPKWKGKGVIINARAETAAQKPMFRGPLQTRRCVIPSTGFYEWRRVNGKAGKEKYLLKEPGKDILYMAGMADTFSRPDGGTHEAFTILTTAANGSVAALHNRMPVILQEGELEAWLRDGKYSQTVLERTCPALMMTLVEELGGKDSVQTSLY